MINRRVWGVVVRHLYSFPRELEAVAEAFWWPTFDLFIYGLMVSFFQSQQGLPTLFISYIIGAVILWMFVYRSQQEMGLVFLREVWDRNILNLLTTPLTIWEFSWATILLGIIKLSLSVVWLSILAFLLFSFSFGSFGFMLLPLVANLLAFGWSTGFLINGMVIRWGYRIQAFSWTLILLFQPFSGVFYPISSMPQWMQHVSRFLPLSYIFEDMRSILGGNPITEGSLPKATLLNLVYLGFCVWFFARSFEKARESGQLVKFS